MKRTARINLIIVLALVLAACAPAAAPATTAPVAPTQAPAPAATKAGGADMYGEIYTDDPALEAKAVGTSEGMPDIAKAAIYRAGLPVSDAMRTLALKCFKDKV